MNLQITSTTKSVDTTNRPYAIRFSEPLSLIEIQWEKAVGSEELHESLAHLLQEIDEKEPRFLIADTRLLSSLGADDQNWIRNSFLPALNTSTVTKFGRVTEPDVFTQAVLDSILDYVQFERFFGCSMRSFPDRESALEWIYAF
ncbi:hypothetical protein [Pontibacter burrus]|uniref:STAS/SEC14 domain-containing protein n=1 Tax=Pontibacter burrus TaxID=2704466 RepID=A0A6B3LKZ1_9BACT|nr:hypothetical protein [Pontibacter burrus]NEM97449.1 hypothetical protein [Pontibacter burrus]